MDSRQKLLQDPGLLCLLGITVDTQGGVTQTASQRMVGSQVPTPKRSGGMGLPLKRGTLGSMQMGLRRGKLPRDHDTPLSALLDP